jgi:hypothetical protein
VSELGPVLRWKVDRNATGPRELWSTGERFRIVCAATGRFVLYDRGREVHPFRTVLHAARYAECLVEATAAAR